MFTFCSLQGAQSESSASQSLLELDGGIKVLIDVGWDETFDVEKLRELEKQIPTLSLILLTHATVPHIAAYAHCCKHFPLFTRIPVYATHPVIALGRTLLQDLYCSTPLASTIIPTTSSFLLQSPTKEEINYYFSLVRPLKYSQPHQPLNGVTITAYNAGHSLGGTIWHIQHGLESIVYAVDWNQARENVLAGAAWLGGAGAGGAEVIEQLRKPTALICSSKGGERVALPGGRAKRDELLLDMIRSSISRGGIVLIPTDSGARMMELAYLLEHAWRTENQEEESAFKSAKPYLAVSTSEMTMRYTRSMFEWMDEAIIREFEAQPGHEEQRTGQQRRNAEEAKQHIGPFEFKHLRLLGRKGQIDRMLNETDNLGRSVGKVILASDTSIEWGFSKEVLCKIADDDKNLLILTERLNPISGAPGLGRTLWSWWEERRDGVISEPSSNGGVLEQVYGGGRDLEIKEPKRIPLEGNDLTVYQQWLATQRQLQTTLQPGGATALEASADIVDDASSDSSSDSDDSENEQQGKALNISATMGQANRKKIGLSDEDLGVNILLRKKGVHDFDVRGKKGRDKMFPMAIRRKRNDDFGELIRPGEFLRAEERDEVDGQEPQRPGKYDTKDTLGKKRKWDDVAASGKRRASNEGKRQQISNNEDGSVADSPEEDDLMDIVEEEIPGPSRLEISIKTLKINLRIAFVDFSGLHDKRSLQMLIPLIQPRKLILVGGMKEETLALASDCRKLLGSTKEKLIDVYTPEVGVIIDASVDTNAWAVKLTDSLVKQLRWQNVKGLGIVTLTGRLETTHIDSDSHNSEGANKKQKMIKEESEETPTHAALDSAKAVVDMPILDVLPSNMASATRSVAQPLHVGDLRLTDLRKIMQSSGLTAELRGEGTLLIDGSVIVRKTGTGRIEVESVGVTTSSFYAVKGKIYEGLAVVAGG
ncbi:Bccft2 [Botrytis cinerea B05.10]|uniref:Cleavage and polyadenylation specificity factor subunit 2 n=3 Tax=Botryotinia fuckeliana TaxID=40559 RepID=A0A384J9V1_BOTFB|nr:Bccft2 [Botrytis cinerea B05.10]ATZ47207.1 Bccft2 [Botrytis cinerea B05.10]EMR86640.1 putative rna-metabolising metallo-beta-lactamase protein [Botrytis cinerea BcDW1]CCD53368.1 similar to cleavage and polyadenylation specificity factor subunit 2 [Botrytis cinerea T4]